MADRTQQILPGGQGAAPFTYTIPASTAFTLLGVKATFNGSGAAGNFLPCVQLVSDADVVMAFGLGSSVTAGGSADVSFAPFLRPQAAASTGGGIQFDTYPQAGTFLYEEATGYLDAATQAALDARYPAAPARTFLDAEILALASGGGDVTMYSPAGGKVNLYADSNGSVNLRADPSGFGVLNMDSWEWFAAAFQIQITAGNNGLTLQASGTGDVIIGSDPGGHVTMPTLPVVNPGGSGRLWNNAGVVSVT